MTRQASREPADQTAAAPPARYKSAEYRALINHSRETRRLLACGRAPAEIVPLGRDGPAFAAWSVPAQQSLCNEALNQGTTMTNRANTL